MPNCFVRRVHPDRAVELSMQEEAENIWVEKFVHVDGDHLTLLNVYNHYVQNSKSICLCSFHSFESQQVVLFLPNKFFF